MASPRRLGEAIDNLFSKFFGRFGHSLDVLDVGTADICMEQTASLQRSEVRHIRAGGPLSCGNDGDFSSVG